MRERNQEQRIALGSTSGRSHRADRYCYVAISSTMGRMVLCRRSSAFCCGANLWGTRRLCHFNQQEYRLQFAPIVSSTHVWYDCTSSGCHPHQHPEWILFIFRLDSPSFLPHFLVAYAFLHLCCFRTLHCISHTFSGEET